jgi:hypothetical protein
MPGLVETAVRRSGTAPLRALAVRLSSAAVIGFATGLIVGGLGGRVAMLALRLTSDPSLRGLETDDGFTIGVISGDTLFLVGFTAFLGVVGGVFYVAIRPWLPPRARPWAFAVMAGAIGGAIVVEPDGIDFTLLEPSWLAVAMFVVLPAAYGYVVAVLVERSFRRPVDERWRALIGLVLLVPVLPFLLTLGLRGPDDIGVVIVAVLVLVLLARRRGIASTWTSPPVSWIGQLGLAVVTLLAAAVLVRDVLAIL